MEDNNQSELIDYKHHTFKDSKKKAILSSKPVIRNLHLIKPDDELLKRLRIKNPGLEEYEKDKDNLDENYQIISGEVEVNGVIFPFYLVIGKDERIFTEQVLANTTFDSDEEKEKFLAGTELKEFEEYIIENLEELSKVDSIILKVIKHILSPHIAFKSRKEFDYCENKTIWAAYANGDGVIGFFSPGFISMVHEFGHLFDFSIGISGDEKWKKLANKYGAALEKITARGIDLSGYDKTDYETKEMEFIADLFNAYYTGDKSKQRLYQVEYMTEEALSALEEEIQLAKIIPLEKQEVFSDHDFQYNNFIGSLEKLRDYYIKIEDQEMMTLIIELMEVADRNIINIDDGNNTYKFNETMYLAILPFIEKINNILQMEENTFENENRESIKTIINEIIEVLNKKIEESKETEDSKKINNSIEYKYIDESLESIKEKVEESEQESIKPDLHLHEVMEKLEAVEKNMYNVTAYLTIDLQVELKNDFESIKEMIKKLSQDGLSKMELKAVLESIRLFNEKINNVRNIPFRTVRIRHKLQHYYHRLKNHYGDNLEIKTSNGTNVAYLLERMIEFLGNVEFINDICQNDEIRNMIENLYNYIDQQIIVFYDFIRDRKNPNKTSRSNIPTLITGEIEDCFNYLLNIIEMEDYNQKVNS